MKINSGNNNTLFSSRQDISLDEIDLNFPKFLTTPMFNMNACIENNYFDSVTDPEVLKASKIRRKYSDIFKWYDAMDIYNEYIEYLLTKYPSLKSIKKGIKEGYIEEFMPPEPVLKKSKDNVAMLSLGVRPSRKTYEYEIDSMVDKLLDREVKVTGLDIDIKKSQMGRKMRKAVSSSGDMLVERKRKENLYSKAAYNPGYDIIKDFYIDEYRFDSKGNVTEKSLLETISEYYVESNMSEIDEAVLELDKQYFRNNRIQNNKELNTIELYKVLASEGYDAQTQLTNSGMKKDAIKLISSKAGLSVPLTKKGLRKLKKKQRRRNQMLENRRQNDEKLSRLLYNSKNALREDLKDNDQIFDFTFDTFMNKKED